MNTLASSPLLDSGYHARARRGGWLPALAIAGLHVAGLYALLCVPAVRQTALAAAPIFVSFIAPPAPEPAALPPKPRTEPPRPKPVPTMITHSQPDVPAAIEAPPVEAKPAPDPAPSVESTTVAAAPAPAAPPAPVVPPNFVAAYLDNPPPVYPLASRRLGEKGAVLLRVHVTAAGGADQVDLHKSSGYARLDRAASDVVRRWRFVPARQGHQAVDAWVIVPITFNLES